MVGSDLATPYCRSGEIARVTSRVLAGIVIGRENNAKKQRFSGGEGNERDAANDAA